MIERGYVPDSGPVFAKVLQAAGVSPITARRLDLGMSLDELSMRCGLDRATLEQLEDGGERPSRSVQEQIAGGMAAPVDRLFPPSHGR